MLALLAIFLLILGGLIFAGSYFLGPRQEKKEVESAIVPTAIIEPTETPTPEPKKDTTEEITKPTLTKMPSPKPSHTSLDQATGLDRSKLSIEVLNGSGIVGAAGEMSDFLKKLGYTIVSVGNADTYDYKNVTIRLKSSQSKFLPLLKKDLGENYTLGDTSTELATSSADAVIIVGK
jgi:hypothetical protein